MPMKNTSYSLLFFLFIVISAYGQKVFRVYENRTYQTIKSFGASDAWSNDVLKKLSVEKRQDIADLLFSMDTNSNGSFKGIGLSLWRFNLGAGSAEQGDSSRISWYRRRTESFMNSDGSYNWNKQSGHLWMLNAAKKYGVNDLVMFINSPHVLFTKNGKAFGNKKSKNSNLKNDKFDDFAGYIARSLEHFDSTGLHFSYISPVNEPQWNWSQKEGQEGSPYLNNEISKLVRSLDAKLSEKKLSTKILITESGTLFCLNSDIRVRPGRQNQIKNFFNKHHKNYVGDLPSVARIISGHSYWTVWPLWWSRLVRNNLRKNAAKYGLDFWMSEYCVLENYRELKDAGKEYDIRVGNIVSGLIYHDLVFGNAVSWQWWTAIEGGDARFSLVNCNGEDARITTTKTLWIIGNYSRFIRPGSVRIAVNGRKNKKLFVSAFLNKNELIVVVVNKSDQDRSIKLKGMAVEGFFRAYETSENRNLENIGSFTSDKPLPVAKRSTTTFVMGRK